MKTPRTLMMKLGVALAAALLLLPWVASGGAVSTLDEQLIQAAARGDLPSIKTFLDKGASVNAADEHGRPVLIQAAARGNLEIVKLLTEKGAVVNASDKDGRTALMAAAWNRYPKILKLLLDRGAHVNAQERNGLTPLMMGSLKPEFPPGL